MHEMVLHALCLVMSGGAHKDHAVLCSQAQEEPVPGSLRCRSRSKSQMTVAHIDRQSWLGYQ